MINVTISSKSNLVIMYFYILIYLIDGIPFNYPVDVPRNLIILAYFYKSYNLSHNAVTRNFLTPCGHLFARD